MVSPNAEVRRATIVNHHTWQNVAWDYYDEIGELRFGINWIANAMSRVNLAAAAAPKMTGDEPVPLDPEDTTLTPAQRRAVEIVSMMGGGPSGYGQLLASFGIHLSVAGIGWLVVEPPLDDPLSDEFTSWEVLSTEEIRDRDGMIEIRTGEREWRPLHQNAVVMRVWRRHPRRSWQADAPVRGVLSILREIDLLSKHIQASAQSRLAGAGLLAIPAEAVFPPGQGPQIGQGVNPDDEDITPPEDMFVDTLVDAMTVPLNDRGSAASVVPLVIKVPGDLVDKIKHVSFATPFDDRVQSLLDQAIKRLALGLDIPPEIVTGTGGMNHWGAWQVAEEAITMHVEPLAETVVHALTLGFLRPALIAEGYDPDEAIVWYDTSDLRTRPDRTSAAVEAYDRFELSGAALLREMGFSGEDLPTDEEKRERILLSVVEKAPALAPSLLAELDYLDDAQVETIATQTEAVQAEQQTRTETITEQGPPQTQPGTVTAALAAACDIIVRRALERAGARLRSAAGKGQPGGAAAIDCPDTSVLHTMIDATAYVDLGTLLDGAWSLVPEVAERYDVNVDELTATLDTYTRALLAARQEHRYGRLAVALGTA